MSGQWLDELAHRDDRPIHYEPPILSPASYRWAVEHGYIVEPISTVTITSVEDPP